MSLNIWPLWKFILRRLAKAQGFLDPMVVVSNLQHFSKPSEVWVPVELLRSGAVLQARGLINSQAIQNNLDWVWPFWVEKQFNPNDKAFIPRAFSLTHINLTHRNWTAVGLPDFPKYPIVDPCGLVTPFFDGWSVDAWIIHDKSSFFPSRLNHVRQNLDLQGTFAVLSTSKTENFFLESRVEVIGKDRPVCAISFNARAGPKSWLMICVRPYNPEGVSFIKDIGRMDDGMGWTVNNKESVFLDTKPTRFIFANYASGDLCEKAHFPKPEDMTFESGPQSISCGIGMATSAALYRLEAGQPQRVEVSIPLTDANFVTGSWSDHIRDTCGLSIPDEEIKFLFNTALKTIILLSPGDIYPGPFTYMRFWFRDAAYILQAMMAAGLLKNIEKILDRFPGRQSPGGYFMSQNGEWDSNGQAIWTMKTFMDITNGYRKPEWLTSIYRAAGWIKRKRVHSQKDPLHKGLLPSGFSAEHFGPSDYYYWDDFWALAGLRSAASLAQSEDRKMAEDFQHEADDMLNCIENSVASVQGRLHHPGIPASPSRRMDAGAIGCLVASYPLQIWPGRDERILQTAKFLMDKYFLQGAFFHEISHSGINVYLTLHVAQVLLRAGDRRYFDILKSVAALATPTGQWPEAIHPRTKGGCMGDGQHIWASAEWVMAVRNMFVREERLESLLILCSGIPKEWIKPGEIISFGPTRTSFGEISVALRVEEHIVISWQARWHGTAPRIEIRLPGYAACIPQGNVESVKIRPLDKSYEYIDHEQYI